MSISIGDRVVKNSGIRSGKSGTVKNILSDGTIAVNFDGEKTSRYCDPGSCTVMNSDNFDNTPIDRYVKSLRSKVPDSNLETWPGDKGAFSYYNKPNGKKLILAIGKAKDVIKPIADKFSADYIITPVDYGRGKWGYSIEPRAWAKRGEFKVENAAMNAKDTDGKELKVGDHIKVKVDMNGRWDGGGIITALKPYRIVEYKDIFGHINVTQENSVRKVVNNNKWSVEGKLSTNAVRNSEFKVGDKVKHAKHGTTGKVIDKDPNLGIYVFWDNGTSGYYKNGDVIIKNSVVHSAINAKFKVGDKVTGSRGGTYPTSNDYGVVVKLTPDGNYVTVKSGKYGRDIDYHESELHLANTALNAKFKIGDYVKWGNSGWHTISEIKETSKGPMYALKAHGRSFYPVSEDDIEFMRKKYGTSPIGNSAVAKNGPHFHGGGDALAEKIVKAVQKYIDAKSEDAKRKAMTEITTLGRTASSLAGGAWVMRDGSVALVDKQPRGATRLMDFVKSL